MPGTFQYYPLQPPIPVTAWQPLATTFTTEPNGNQLASAASQGVGIYALLATTEQSHTTYIPIVQR